jgi:hypothetical protein
MALSPFVWIILIPFLIINDVNLFVTIMLIIVTVIYISSCYAVYKQGYKNVPAQVVFPLVRLGKNGINNFKNRFSNIKWGNKINKFPE